MLPPTPPQHMSASLCCTLKRQWFNMGGEQGCSSPPSPVFFPALQPRWGRSVPQVIVTLVSLCCLGTSAQGSPLLASLPLPGRPLQPQLDLKHLMPFKLNGSSPLSLFPNFNTVSVSPFGSLEVEPITL